MFRNYKLSNKDILIRKRENNNKEISVYKKNKEVNKFK